MRSLVANRPLLGAAICLGIGIHMGVMAHSSPWVWATLSIAIALGWLGFPRWREKGSFVIACLLIAVLGALLSTIPRTQMRHLQERLAPMEGRAVNVRGMVSGTGRWSRWGWQIPLRVEFVNNHKITAFESDWRLPVTESPPAPGTLIQMNGRWKRVPLEQVPNRQERDGLCGRMSAEQWHAIGRVVTINGLLFDGKRRLEGIGERTLSRESAEVLHGMAYNEPIRDSDRIESFQRTGLIHILSVGGLHIGFLAVLLVGVGSLLRIPRKGIYYGVLFILPLFIIMVGAEPPAVRAGIMSGLVILGFLLERPVDGVNLWGAAALSVLLFKPLDLYDLGFQLSFGAAGSILWLFPIWRRAVPMRWRPFADPVILSLTAQVGVLPLLALYFGVFPWVGLLANIVIIPLSTIAVQLGLAAEVLGMLWNPLAMILNTSNELILHGIIGVIRWFSDWGTPFALPLFNEWGVLLYYLGIFAIAKLREVNPITHQYRIPQWIQLAILAILVSLGAGWVLAQAPPDHLRVEVIDVGQGDSILLTAPGGKRLLIDGGPGESFKSSLRLFLRRRMITRLDKVVLT
ncbi:MAG TPA: ComEC/Rec2 family competence protein, partial [Bacillota bacterium]|nr:ComEC/Rec2 family competence protein [Bacillota bacterium]